jgi:hypothetical protein
MLACLSFPSGRIFLYLTANLFVMKRSPTYLLVILFISFTTLCLGQTFYDGYIVRNGAKVEGSVQYKPAKKDFSRNYVMFREAGRSEASKLTPDEIERFHINSTNSTFISTAHKDLGKNVFTEIIQEGPVTLSFNGKLYALTKENGDVLNLYIPITGKNIYEFKEELVDKKLAEMKSIGLIKNFLEDCEKVSFREYTTSNINRAVSRYNACKGKPTFPGKARIQTGVVAGYIHSFVEATGAAFQPQPGFKVGATFDVQPKSYQVRTLLAMQLVFAQETMRDEFNVYDNSLTTLRLPIMLKNYVRPGRTGLYFFPGISFYTPIKVEERKLDYLDYKKLGVSYFFGAGYELMLPSGKRVAAAIRYERDLTTFLEAADAFGSTYSLAAYQYSVQLDLIYKF